MNKFLTNTSKTRFIDEIKKSLKTCNSFSFSVSFIKKAGLDLISSSLESALSRGAKGRIICSTYQNFTDIRSLELFLSWQNKYSNFECRLEDKCFADNGFHTKGYLFEFEDEYEVIIGSSNITRFALLKNFEWDISHVSKDKKELFEEVISEFDLIFNEVYPLTSKLIQQYSMKLQYAINRWDMDYFIDGNDLIRPNKMQQSALKELSNSRDRGIDKCLIIAATATGKTYLAAFDALNFNAKRLLFIVHNDFILIEALKTFQKIFGGERTYGLFNGDNFETDRDFIFSTNLMMSSHLDIFAKDEFDYIIIDEVHHATESTYKAILSYFKPQFLLGLTATPDRMDNKDVLSLFDYNVPYELNLRDALVNNLIVPFKYYGIDDDLIDYRSDAPDVLIKSISHNLHCDFIREQIEKYRPKGKLKALAFCVNRQHARTMAEKMNMLGYHTLALTGEDNTGERIRAYSSLQDDEDPLEIIFTINIANEGVDIPAINTVLFLRPTESSTIFIQQLGRGLRKYNNKDYLTVLDFIANSYSRSVQIALALGSLKKRSFEVDKVSLQSMVISDFKTLNLPIEIHIDEIAKEKILKSIENTKFNTRKVLAAEYHSFKKYLDLNEAPTHMDFLDNHASDMLVKYIRIYKSYYKFLSAVNDNSYVFDNEQLKIIDHLSFFIPLIRPYEFFIVRYLILNGSSSISKLMEELSVYEINNEESFNHALKMLQANSELYNQNKRDKYPPLIVQNENDISLSFDISSKLFKDFLLDLLNFGLGKFDLDFNDATDNLLLFKEYTREQAFIALNNKSLFSMSGIENINGNYCFFIDLNKDLQKKDSLKYKDRFLSDSILQWESQTATTMENGKGKKLVQHKKVKLFVRKIKKEDGVDKPYIYLGEGTLTNLRNDPDNINKIEQTKTVLSDIVLDNKIPSEYLYEFGVIDDEKTL